MLENFRRGRGFAGSVLKREFSFLHFFKIFREEKRRNSQFAIFLPLLFIVAVSFPLYNRSMKKIFLMLFLVFAQLCPCAFAIEKQAQNIDWNPYMAKVKESIKNNWKPPKENESRNIIVKFRIEQEGELLGIKLVKSSGVDAVDKAALAAVKKSAPFAPLPKEHKDEYIDIVFTFDYNVIKEPEKHPDAKLRKYYVEVSSDKKVIDALEILKDTTGEHFIKIILGDNLSKRPMQITFKDLGAINPKYANIDVLGWKKGKDLYIFINTTHIGENPAVLAPLIASRTAHQDAHNSISRQVYVAATEAAVWSKILKANLDNYKNTCLVERMNFSKSLFEKGNYSAKYMWEEALNNKLFADLPRIGRGFEDVDKKIKELLERIEFVVDLEAD